MKLICPDCGRQYESGKFCLECGGKLQEVTPELVCPSCGYKAKSGKFCPECGTKLTEQIATVEETSNPKSVERTFNEKDPRFAKYYDKKGSPRTIPQEERDVTIEELTLFANQDIAEAKMLLGYILMSNAKNEDTAFKAFNLLKEAEEAGDKFAYYLIGYFYYMGAEPLLEQDHSEAEKRMLEYYKEYENGDAAQLLAELYAFSTEKCDYKKAFDYATIAAEDDECGGYLVLGALYLNGWGVEKDINLALENYKMAAALGDETAMNQMGMIYSGNENYESNPEQSFYWFNEAAKKGSPDGMYNLGWCYKNGFGIEADVEKAAEWFKKSAELGYVDAMCDLGEYYQDTLIDFKKAKMWYLKAAELGHAEAQNKLGVLYADIENDYAEAVKWYKKAIEQNNPWAYRNLGICYLEGNGVKQDLKKAKELFSKASELGIEDASDLLNGPNYSPDANMQKIEEPSDSETHHEFADNGEAKPLKKSAIAKPFTKILDINGGNLKPSYGVGIDLFFSMEIRHCEGTKIKLIMTLNPLLEGATISKEDVFVIDKDNYLDFDGYKEKIENNLFGHLFLIFANDFGLSKSGEYYYKVNLSAYDEQNNVLSSYDCDLTIKYNHKIFGSDKIKIKEIG